MHDNASVQDDRLLSFASFPRFPPHLLQSVPFCSCERRGTVPRIIFTHVSVTPAEKCPLKPRVEVSRSCAARARGREDERTRDGGNEDRRNRDEGTVRGPKAKQLMIPSRHEYTTSESDGDVPVHARRLCRVSHDRERAVTPVGALDREKKARPIDILMPLCVCVFGMSRFIADSNRSRRGPLRRGAARRRWHCTAPVWKYSLGQGHGASRR